MNAAQKTIDADRSISVPLYSDIHYITVVPDWTPEEATPLQGFSFSLCKNSRMFRAVKQLPSNIYDYTEEGLETFLPRRIGGVDPINWFPQSPRAIKSMPMPVFMPFIVVMLDDSEDPQDYADWVKDSGMLPTIVAKKGGDLTFDQLTTEGLQQRFLQVCDLIPKEVDPDSVDGARNAIKSWKKPTGRKLDYELSGHSTITPNLTALSAAGFVDMAPDGFKDIKNGIQPYVDQIVLTTRSVFDERDAIGEREAHWRFRRPPDLNFYAPAIYPHFFSLPIPDTLTPDEKRRFRLARKLLEDQTGYAFELRSEAQVEALSGSVKPTEKDFDPHFLFRLRQMELFLGTECVSALAGSEISAVIRLPNDINRTIGVVRQFALLHRSHKASDIKKLRSLRNVQKRLATAFPLEFYEFIDRSESGIRIISDAHVEWLDIDGLPLFIRKDISRIPVTPGNLFVTEVGAKAPLYLSPEDFREVLVISALKRDDPIQYLFKVAFETFEKVWRDKLKLTSVEVSSKEELISALNDFSGALVVFDGHGSHQSDEPAYLHLMDDKIDIWDLNDKINRPPPIVVLSACDTHGADRNHATTANGFLSLGTRAVLGSVFPLDAREAAVFTARLLYRVSTFVPAAIGRFGRAVTWTEVVSGMLRMQLLTDFMKRLENKKLIDESIYYDVHQKGNMAINGEDPDPFQVVADLLAAHGIDEATFSREMELAVATSSTISYLNIGRPETIVIGTEELTKGGG